MLAKANPGGALRKTAEAQIENPALMDKGGIGTLSRAGLEEPINRQVPPGSTKVVSSSPAVEPNVAPSGVLPTQPITSGIGLPEGNAPQAPTPVRGAGSPVPNVGFIQPTVRSQATGAQAKTTSGGALSNAGASVLTQQKMGGQTNVQGQPSTLGAEDYVNPFVGGALGGKVRADEGGSAYRPTTLQQIAGSVGSAMQKAGDAAKAGLAGPAAQLLRSVVGSTGTAGNLQRFGGDPNVAKAGTGSVQKAAQSAVSALRSYNPVQTFQSNVNKTTSFLRSLFGR